ncbi:uncharacterized protein with PCYCGC motif [Ureibacillus xyleni]|uniref:Uncharacterized protein with PCYCGC motif n=1 Tax=Ureibacillus xyleni TaxID=614648 RepID=A0A285THW2_9BACL|nr:PCYCGC motif-containing (lipo)protein [Ureibacillus xyleni]SOC21850.1 uncharacterized protein with PCYCGC motif [Ureibacillus xyleni]
MKKLLLPLLGAILLTLTACSATEDSQGRGEQVQNQGTEGLKNISQNPLSGDLQELTTSANEPPKFLDSQSEEIRLVYAAAGQASDILQWIPCYCGCGESAGHRSNLNCFIAETHEDGSIVWDDHGTRCGVCLEIAIESVQLHQDGKTVKEIRETIDTKYKDGYAPPTPTEMPA